MTPFSGRLSRYGSVLLFPLAMIIYDFSAYLTTDLIQPGVINIINELQADVTLAPVSVSLYMAGGLALQWLLGPLSDRVGRRPVLLTGAMIFATGMPEHAVCHLDRTVFYCPFYTGNQYLLHLHRGLCINTGGL